MKILISGMNTAGFIHNFGRGLSELGHEVTTVTFSDNKFYNHHFSYTFDQTTFVTQQDENTLAPSKEFFSFIEKFDLFIFISGLTLLPGMRDLPILHKLGKKIIIRNTGSALFIPARLPGIMRARPSTCPSRSFRNSSIPNETGAKRPPTPLALSTPITLHQSCIKSA